MLKPASQRSRIVIAFFAVTLFGVLEYYRTFSFASLIPHPSPYVKNTSWRMADGLTFLLIAFFLTPKMRRYLRLPSLRKRWLPLLGITNFVLLPYFSDIYAFRHDLSDLARGTYWVIAIGFTEELFSRFLIFGLLTRYVGLWPAMVISSINFGMMHLGNLHQDGQGLQETLLQVSNAVSFGFMMVALLIYFRSIWVPILMHAFSDFSLSIGPYRPSATRTTGGITGHGLGLIDWATSFTLSAIHIAIALALLYRVRVLRKSPKIQGLLHYFGLTE